MTWRWLLPAGAAAALVVAVRAEVGRGDVAWLTAIRNEHRLVLILRAPRPDARVAVACAPHGRVALDGRWFPPGRARGYGAGPDDALGLFLPAEGDCQVDVAEGRDVRSACIDGDGVADAGPCDPPLGTGDPAAGVRIADDE